MIGALVPAAIMSIAAANLWTRNVYKAFINRDATHAQEAKQAKVVSLLVKFGALVFVLALSKDFAINLQLLGGVWILQTMPGDRDRPVHALDAPVGAVRRVGGRHGLRHLARVRRRLSRPSRTSAARW